MSARASTEPNWASGSAMAEPDGIIPTPMAKITTATIQIPTCVAASLLAFSAGWRW